MRFFKKFSTTLIISAYYIGALLLMWAGIGKLNSPGVGDILESLFDHNTINLAQLLFISRWFPLVEIIIASVAIIGYKAHIIARIMSLIYIVFTALIFYVAEGYFLLPIDCGCFGEGQTTPVYLLLLRNSAIALPLLFFTSPYCRFTLYGHVTGKH